MNSKTKSFEELKNHEINYFKVIWGWKWAVTLIPLIAMITAKLTEQTMPEIYETKASIIISEHGSRKPLSRQSFESIAFLPVILEKIIDQLSLKKADGTSMDQTTLKNQLKTKIPGQLKSPVHPGFLFFIVRNKNPDLAKTMADLWVQLVEKEAKKMEAFNFSVPAKLPISLSPKEIAYINRLENGMLSAKENQLRQNIGELMRTELQITEKKSELSTYQKRLKKFSNSNVLWVKVENNTLTQSGHSAKKKDGIISLETTLHSALKSLISNRELQIEALSNKMLFLNTNIKKLEQELFDLTQAYFSGELLKKFQTRKESQTISKPVEKFVSSIASINHAPVVKTPVAREKYTHIFLAGIISFGFILFACVLKAHVDALRQDSKKGS